MHGRRFEGEIRRPRHMWTEPPLGPTTLAAPSSSAQDFFLKDGRKVTVGDCALFQSGNSPPFIGIVRSFALDEAGSLQNLCVNWLYRPGDIKLSKGLLLEAAPNEVFYSFHKDEIAAATLLHPCKVAFLRKDVELPPGISSFVCRRVYDIANKRLWWLTDKDYINERQEEVDQLLDRTRLEMHAAVSSGARSPKSLNGPTSTQQLKSGSDNRKSCSDHSGHNSSSSVPHQGKSKKRERGDQVVENHIRETLSKRDEGNSSLKESNIKFEIAEIADKDGGLVNFEAVDKLVHLMQFDRVEKKIDLTGRMMLADVIAATDNNDCLCQFVQLRGVPVLDDWLQEAHKGKIGEGSSPKESEKSNDALLLSLLHALDKLPVNLHALQTCNVGKSVNHLRTHKNLEIQKKARILVDTWKKRVEAEMKINDAKDDARSTNDGSDNTCKKNNSPRPKSSSGYVNSSLSGVKKAGNSKGGSKVPLPDRASQSGSMSERICDLVVDHGTSQRLIVRIPRSMSGGSFEDPPATGSQTSSPAVSGKIDSRDRKMRGKGDYSRSSTTGDVIDCSWQGNDLKGRLGGSDEGSPSHLPDVHQNETAEESGKSINGYRGAHRSVNESHCMLSDEKLIKRFESSLSSIDVLIDSCANDSLDTSAPLPVGDETGMNLLASVATGEMSKSDLNSTNSSLQKNYPIANDVLEKLDKKLKDSCLDSVCEVQYRPDEFLCKSGKNPNLGSSPMEAGISKNAVATSGGNKSSLCENSCLREHTLQCVEDEVDIHEAKVDEMNQHGPTICLASVETEGASFVERKDTMEARLDCEFKEDTIAVSHDGATMKEEIVKVVDPLFEGKHEDDDASLPVTNRDSFHRVEASNGHENDESVSCVKVETGDELVESPIKLGEICVKSRTDKLIEHDLSSGASCPLEINAASKLPILNDGFDAFSKKVSEMISHLSTADEKPYNFAVMPGIIAEKFKETCETKENGKHSPERKAKSVHHVPPPVSSICLKSTGCKLSDGEAVDVAKYACNKECSASLEESGVKAEFDLNEGFPPDEGSMQDVDTSPTSSRPSTLIPLHDPLTFSESPTASLPASITVTAAAKGPFLASEDLLRSKGELRWKGSAATSAFRRAEPRKLLEISSPSTADILNSESGAGKNDRPWLDFDLNVPDDGVLEDVSSLPTSIPPMQESMPASVSTLDNSTTLDLDLNRLDGNSEQGIHLQSNVSQRLDVLPVTSGASCSGFDTEANVLRNFDLNDGPGIEEASVLDSISRNRHLKSSVPFMLGIPGVRLNSGELGGFSSWLPGSSYPPAMAAQSFLPDRGEQPFSLVSTGGAHQRILGPASDGEFGPDVFPVPVLSSSPMPYSAASAPFPYSGFHFGTSFPIPSASFSVASSAIMVSSVGGSSCFPAVPSHFSGPGGTISTLYPRSLTFPDAMTANVVSDNNWKWNRQGCLDLNAGPGGVDGEARNERLQPHVIRQISVGSSLEEQARMYQAVKRKEPEGGWDADRPNHKQPSWQ